MKKLRGSQAGDCTLGRCAADSCVKDAVSRPTPRFSHPTRVLMVVGSLDVGGVEMDIIRNMPQVDREQFDISVYAFLNGGELAPLLVAKGIKVFVPRNARAADSRTIAPEEEVHKPRRPVGWRAWSQFRASMQVTPMRHILRLWNGAAFAVRLVVPLAWHIVSNRVSIVHCFLPHAYIVGGLAAALVPGCRLVMSRVSSNFYMEKWRIYRPVETRVLHRLLDRAICNSEAIRSELIEEGLDPRKITLLYNGLDCSLYTPSPERRREARTEFSVGESQLVFTTVANLHKYKGHADLIEALGLISARLPGDWQLLCAGRDLHGEEALLRRRADELGIGGHVRFLGSINNVALLLSASDIHVHPSHEESFPNSILEAMAARLPIVASEVGGIPELVSNGEGGLLVPPGNPKALGHALEQLVCDPATRAAMGACNARRAESHFSLGTSVRRYEMVYRGLVGL